MSRLNLQVFQLYLMVFYQSVLARLSPRNFARALSIFTVLGLVGMVFLVSPDASASTAQVSTEVSKFQADVVALLGNILTAVIAIGSAAIVIFIANTALRWLRAAA